MKKIYITTAHTGYNYGTYLQAYAMKKFIGRYADYTEIVWERSFGEKGRDFRIKKILSILFKSLIYHKQSISIRQGYAKNFSASPNEKSKKLFNDFSENYLSIKEYSLCKLKKITRKPETIAVVCGSDQIWNASSMYPDPLYYLQFAPKKKRIAYAPSFGRREIPEYNRKIIKKYINGIPTISVREETGVNIIKNLTGKDVPVMPDPTLLVDWHEWELNDKSGYILVYFLDSPSQAVIDDIKRIQEKTSYNIKVLLHNFGEYGQLNNMEFLEAGPIEFVKLISGASFVCTDSFHATVFSMILHTSFYTYNRNYGKVAGQESRIETILTHYNMLGRLRSNFEDEIELECSFEETDKIRKMDVLRADTFMKIALNRGKEIENIDH